MALPGFYQPERVGTLYTPNTTAAVDEGRNAELTPARADRRRIILLLVDAQVDFIHTDGSLSVPGAIDDTRRTVEWIYNNIGRLTSIAASLDSHVPIQIFSPLWWVDADGQHPEPYTPISSTSVLAGRWTPLYEPDWSRYYVEKLELQSKKQLMIWPYHTLIGTPGHNLTPALYEALAFHSAARQEQPIFLNKGTIPKTEHYSMLEPEVKVQDHPQGGLNTQFLEMLDSYDVVYVAGQAKSHCVLETITSMMRFFKGNSAALDKLRLLIDCTSSVHHPEIDFDAIANEALAEYTKSGLHLVKSTDPIV
jgi:nicotinamidase/pyrazinamidase